MVSFRRNKATESKAGPDHGTTDPDDVTRYNIFADGKKTAIVLRWKGNGYSETNCWISASLRDVIDLDNAV